MTDFHWKLVGGCAIGLIVFTLIGCGLDGGSVRECVRSNVIGGLGYLLLLGSLATGTWLGMATAAATDKAWLGWCIGLAVAFGLSYVLEWIGILPELLVQE
jgi:hypothetical protein